MSLEFLTTAFARPPVADWNAVVARRTAALSPDLPPAFLAVGRAGAGLDALVAGDALCVTTGQQPGLFLGPLYTIYKALTTIALADRLQASLARPVVPVFWVAGDDHDFLESSQAFQLSRDGDVERLALPPRPADAPLIPMYRTPLGPGIAEALEALWAAQPETEFRAEVEVWLRREYRPDATVADAFANALADLLGPRGLLVFRPTHAAAKEAMRPWVRRALEGAVDLERALVARSEALRASERPVPVAIGDGASLVMLEGQAGRDRLVLDGRAFTARRSGERYTLSDLEALLDAAPERFSPNVLLRPVIEAALLPTLAYVGGPGELAYLPQCEPVYQRLGVAPQVPVPRWSGTVLETRSRKVLDKYGIPLDDLRLPEGQLEQRLVRGELPAEGTAALEALRESLERQYEVLQRVATDIDATLRKPVEAARNAALTGLRDIEKRVLSHLKQRNETLVQQLARTRAALFPLGKPQERVLDVAPFLVRYGAAFLDMLGAEIGAWGAGLEGPRGHP